MFFDVLKEWSSTVLDVEGGKVASAATTLDQVTPTQGRE